MQHIVDNNPEAEGCTAPETGRNLDLYELDMLDEKDKRAFEMHLFACPYCFEQVRTFAPAFAALRRSPEELFRLPVPVDAMNEEAQAGLGEKAGIADAAVASAAPAVPQSRPRLGERLIGRLHSLRERYSGFTGSPALAYAPALGLVIVMVAVLLLLPADTGLKQDKSVAALDSTTGIDKSALRDTAAESAPETGDIPGGLYAQLAEVEAAPYVPVALLGFGDDDTADSLFHAGMDFYVGKQYDRAIRPLSRAAALNPGHAEANLYLGICRLLTGSAREAMRPLSSAAGAGDGALRDKAHWYKGQAHLLLNEGSKAREEFRILSSGGGKYASEAGRMLRQIDDVDKP